MIYTMADYATSASEAAARTEDGADGSHPDDRKESRCGRLPALAAKACCTRVPPPRVQPENQEPKGAFGSNELSLRLEPSRARDGLQGRIPDSVLRMSMGRSLSLT
jgi:hypothetical protein